MSRRVSFGIDYLRQASKVLELEYPDISETLSVLAETLWSELPDEERQGIKNAEKNILGHYDDCRE